VGSWTFLQALVQSLRDEGSLAKRTNRGANTKEFRSYQA
jgi:hypothetical protein